MEKNEFKHFRKLQSRYWVNKNIHPKDLINDFTQKIEHIENRVFGENEDDLKGQTQLKIILNGLSVKIYYFLKQAIIYTENKEYISAIALLRLCLEHIVMLSYFESKYSSYIKENNIDATEILLHSFCAGERIYYADLVNKNSGKKIFTSRSEHVSDALRRFDKKYKKYGVQILYDTLSSHSHVTPTSSVRMLFRQKVWNVDEPYIDYKKVRLSTISNSHEKTASVGVEILNILLDVVAKDVIDKESELAKSFERIVIMDSNNEISPSVRELIKGHDEAAQEYLAKLKKYGEPEV